MSIIFQSDQNVLISHESFVNKIYLSNIFERETEKLYLKSVTFDINCVFDKTFKDHEGDETNHRKRKRRKISHDSLTEKVK